MLRTARQERIAAVKARKNKGRDKSFVPVDTK